MSLGDSIRSGAKWLLAGSAAGQVLQFGFGVALARLLDPSDFGMLVTIQVFTGLAGFVSGAGMGTALVRSQSAALRDFQAVFTAQLLIGMLIYAAFFSIAPWFARWYGNPLYADLLRVSAVFFLIRPFGNLANAWMTREMRFKQKAVVGFWVGVATGIASIAMAWTGVGVWSLVLGGLIGTILGIGAMLTLIPVRPRLLFDFDVIRRMGAYGFKTTLNDFVSYLRLQAPNFVLSRVGGAATVGLFNKADSLMRTPLMIGGAIYEPIFRSMAKAQENKDQCRYLYLRAVTLLAVYMLPLFVGLAWLADPLVVFVYGDKWMDSAGPLSILCLGGLFACIGYPAGAVLAAQNWLGREAVVHSMALLLVAGAAFFGIRWGLIGVAWGLLIAHAYSTVHHAWLVNRCIGTTFRSLLRSLMPGASLNVTMVAGLLILEAVLPQGFSEHHRVIYLILTSTVGAGLYALAFFLLPIPALAGEQDRWKSRLALVARS